MKQKTEESVFYSWQVQASTHHFIRNSMMPAQPLI